MPALPATLVALSLTVPTAAAEGRALAVGMQASVNDPNLIEKGPTLTLEQPLAPGLALALGGTAFLDGGRDDWKALTSQLVENNHVMPDISRQRWRADLAAHWTPFEVWTERAQGHLGLHTGIGLVRTDDDLELLQQEGDLYALATDTQVHPTTSWGLFMDLGGARLRGRVGLERVVWIETISSTTLEMHRPILLTAAFVLRQPAPAPEPDEATDQAYEGDTP